MIYRPIKIDCTKDNLKREKISMYEHGAVSFEFTCLNGNQQIDLSECTNASYIGTKPDGHLVGIACEIKDGKVILPISLQMTTAPGILEGVLVLYFDSGNVRFNGVNFEILECPDEAEIESTDEFTILEDMIAELKKLAEQGGATDEQIANAVDNYLKNNPSTQNGKSAYEIAVENGFEGTEAEWLESLKGKDAVVDQNYNSDSENAVSAKALEPILLRKLSLNDSNSSSTLHGLWMLTAYASKKEFEENTVPTHSRTLYYVNVVEELSDSTGRTIPKGYYLEIGSPKFGICALWSYESNTLYCINKTSEGLRITSSKDINDVNNYFENKTIDGVFAEIGEELQNLNSAEYKQEIANIIKTEYEAELLEILGGDENVTE